MPRSSDLIQIGKFARQAGLSIHQLRRYDEAGLLQPGHVDSESGYRYYSPVQVEAAELIALLRSLDLPLAEIRRLLAHPEDARVILPRHRGRLEDRFTEAQHRLDTFDRLIAGGLMMAEAPPTDLVPVTVDSVRVHEPTGQHVVLLQSDEPSRVLPIWIGPPEANAIAGHLAKGIPERPTTHDLMAALANAAEVEVQSVTIWRSAKQPDLFLAETQISVGSRSERLDSRPSDAINLALRTGAPINVSAMTLAAAGRPPNETGDLPSPLTTVELVDGDNRPIAVAEAYQRAEPGFRAFVYRNYEVVEVSEGRAVVRELEEATRATVYRWPGDPTVSPRK
jgi:bifunctional DNase/RNase